MTTVLLTDGAWPDESIEREVIGSAGFRLVSGPAEPGPAAMIEALMATHRRPGGPVGPVESGRRAAAQTCRTYDPVLALGASHRDDHPAHSVLLRRIRQTPPQCCRGGCPRPARRASPVSVQPARRGGYRWGESWMNRVASVHGRQVLDSRGRPTIEVDVVLGDGVMGRASVPSGASTGTYEAHELRDGDQASFGGLGVLSAAGNVNGEIADTLRGHDVMDQAGADAMLRELDGTPALSRLGANAILGTSLALCRASAAATRQPLYRRIAELAGVDNPVLPMPMVNILSGGLHAGRSMDVQDFLAVPIAANSMREAIYLAAKVRDAAALVAADRGLPTLLADEGGLSPGCPTGRDALDFLVTAIERAGLIPGRDIAIAIDVAAAALADPESGRYHLRRERRHLTTAEMIDVIASWVSDFPIVSIEDPLDEEDWAGWRTLTSQLGDRVRIVGDDLFTTNPSRLARGVAEGCANGVLIKVNQNGTLTGTLTVLAAARNAGYVCVVSARSGETEDDLLADLAVGTAAGQIKIGSMRSSERLAKYNQLIRIAEDPAVAFAGASGLERGPAPAESMPS